MENKPVLVTGLLLLGFVTGISLMDLDKQERLELGAYEYELDPRYNEFLPNVRVQQRRASGEAHEYSRVKHRPYVYVSPEQPGEDLVQSSSKIQALVTNKMKLQVANDLMQSVEEPQAKVVDSNSDTLAYNSDVKESKVHSIVVILLVMSAFILIKICGNTSFASHCFKSENFERKAYYSLLKDICFMVSIMMVVLIIHYYEGFSSFDSNIDNVLYGMFFFILLWMIFGYLTMKSSFKMLKQLSEWDKTSCNVSKLHDLKRTYENQFYERNGKVDKKYKEQIRYLFMKQGFINPIELPIVTESFLRRDFNFSLYLGLCLSDFMSKLYSFDSQTYFMILFQIIIWKILSVLGIQFISIMMVAFPVISLVFLYTQKVHFTQVYNALVPRVDSPESINFQVDVDIRDPFDHYDTMQFPPYMEQTMEDNKADDSDEQSEKDDDDYSDKPRSRSGSKVSSVHNRLDNDRDSVLFDELSKRKTSMFKSPENFMTFRQNRHERLFHFGKLGMLMQKLSLQAFFLQMIIWAANIADNKFSSCPILTNWVEDYYITNIDAVDYVLLGLAVIVCVYSLLAVFPGVCFQYMIITHIQMMKRRDLIEETIKDQRNHRSERSFRMYQVFKLIRRELIQYFHQDTADKTLRPFTKKLIEENFSLCKLKDKENMDALSISEFFPLCGVEIKKLENFILLKKAQSKGETLKFKDLITAIEQTTNDVKVDPFEVVKSIFTLIMKRKEKLSINDVKHFFSVYDGYFEREDVIDFCNELVAIQRDGSLIDVQEIASLIRDDIECFPR